MSCHENTKKRRFHGWTNPVLITTATNGMGSHPARQTEWGQTSRREPKGAGAGMATVVRRAPRTRGEEGGAGAPSTWGRCSKKIPRGLSFRVYI
jgi:hypothetical protein